MKYGRIVYDNKESGITKYTNVGDWFQTFAVDYFYESIGIDKKQIVELHRNELSTYSGEKVLVILQGWFNQLNRKDFFPLSEDIVPVYLGLHRTEKKNLKFIEDEWIGCRDEDTYNLMKSLNFKAYISGCLTVTFPLREKRPSQTDLFLVDVPKSLYEYIPQKYQGKTHIISQEIEISEDPEKQSREILDLYKEKAALVVTSRLHCAAPCLGMGIPVILVREYFDGRYGWIDKYMKLYEPKEFNQIDWDTKEQDLTAIKELMYDILKLTINKEELLEDKINLLHEFYFARTKSKLSASLKAKFYWKLSKIMPNFSNFLRWKVLKRYSVLGANTNKSM